MVGITGKLIVKGIWFRPEHKHDKTPPPPILSRSFKSAIKSTKHNERQCGPADWVGEFKTTEFNLILDYFFGRIQSIGCLV